MAFPGVFTIPRRTVEQPAGEAGLWAKMFDPPNVSPMTPELLVPDNPVPEVMAAAGLAQLRKANTVVTDLMHGDKIPAWDGKEIIYFLFRQKGNDLAKGTFPGPTIRIPRGAIFHAETQGHGPPPHTIHWHGQEPTPLNDGVGHCSMEIGKYTYQFQPNAMGFYFYHCHRNTVQHFEFGLYGALLIDPPTAYFASQTNPAIPIGQVPSPTTPGAFEFRVQANTTAFPQFPGFLGGDITTKDSLNMTVPYDVEALWVFDDRDSVWSDFAPDPRAFFPRRGNNPGVNDRWAPGFFNDFNADYWFVTGVDSDPSVIDPGAVAGPGFMGRIPPDLLIPSGLNSGVGRVIGEAADRPELQTQISINAPVGKTVLVRALNAAYDNVRVTFPFDVVVISWDGRALGVPPFGNYNRPFVLPGGVSITYSVARRMEVLFRTTALLIGTQYATVEFIRNHDGALLHTTLIPITVTA